MTSPQSTPYLFELKHMPAQFNDSGFLQGEDLSGLVPTNFTFDIHKIFDRKNFHGDEFDYSKLDLPLRMTSALLTAAIPIFHSILVAGCLDTKATTDDGKSLYQFPDPVESLSPEEVYTTWRRLDQLAEGISFHIGGTEQDAIAWCDRLLANDGSLGPGLQGCGSTISIGKGLYHFIVNPYTADGSDIIIQQASAFNLATTLIHELTHAAVNAATPYSHEIHEAQHFLGESARTTEIGFETEAWLFGGVTPSISLNGFNPYYNKDTDKVSRLNYLLTTTEWPCPSMTAQYERNGDRMHVRGEQRSTEVLWNASFLHIHKLFQDEFWTDVFPRFGRRHLRFERATGFRFQVRGEDLELKPLLGDADRVVDLPGYYVDETGMIRRQCDRVHEKEGGGEWLDAQSSQAEG